MNWVFWYQPGIWIEKKSFNELAFAIKQFVCVPNPADVNSFVVTALARGHTVNIKLNMYVLLSETTATFVNLEDEWDSAELSFIILLTHGLVSVLMLQTIRRGYYVINNFGIRADIPSTYKQNNNNNNNCNNKNNDNDR